ncbi:GNAT family N-acetyltransferase [Spirillospora albida]|uniref:GNAT family N-acetyltransferase n=1 Tax=Spirillospora albida TaxID=58123 RepID=UPI000562EAF0|nr:GNAT family N-acetyltransferase [Spirillospora albida]
MTADTAGAPRTQRLLLRQWRDTDREPFAAMNADPHVMEHFPAPLSRTDSDALADRAAAAIERDGWGLWALEIIETGAFIGFTGLNVPAYDAPFMPATEIGWRLARTAWGHGYATEAARAALAYAFGELALEEVVSFTTTGNHRSRAVMERIGMTRDPRDDFDHPLLPEGHPLRRHVLYRITATPSNRQPGSRQGTARTVTWSSPGS